MTTVHALEPQLLETIVWSDKALHRFKHRIRQLTGHSWRELSFRDANCVFMSLAG